MTMNEEKKGTNLRVDRARIKPNLDTIYLLLFIFIIGTKLKFVVYPNI